MQAGKAARQAGQAKRQCGVDIVACIDVDAGLLPRFQKSASRQGGRRKRSGIAFVAIIDMPRGVDEQCRIKPGFASVEAMRQCWRNRIAIAFGVDMLRGVDNDMTPCYVDKAGGNARQQRR